MDYEYPEHLKVRDAADFAQGLAERLQSLASLMARNPAIAHPIETAPRDGTRVLAYSPVDGWFSSHWEGGIWQGQAWRAGEAAKEALSTHWMRLPEHPPKEKGRE